MPKTFVLRIRNWKKIFENNRSREIKRPDWVPMPNHHDGIGYTELLDHPNGLSHYGAWALTIQVASKCEIRGTLLRDGVRPYSARDLARATRASEKVFVEAIPRLLEIGWLEQVALEEALNPAEPTPDTALACGDVAPSCASRARGREGTNEQNERREGIGKTTPNPRPAPHFEPVKSGLYRREYDAMLKDADGEIKRIKADLSSWDSGLSTSAKELVEFLSSEKRPGWETRVAEIQTEPANRVRTKLTAQARSHIEAWEARKDEIRKAMNGIKQ